MTTEVRRLMVQALRQMEEGYTSKTEKPKSREGKKVIAGHFDESIAWQFKKLALDQQVTVQSLLSEAIDDLFHKYHLTA